MCNITHILAQVEQWQDAEKGAIELLEAENSGGGELESVMKVNISCSNTISAHLGGTPLS